MGSIEQIRGKYLGKQENKNQDAAALKGNSFRDVLLSQAQKDEGTDRARQKGIKESLIVVDELAFIVNVKNNTVVTAVGDSEDKIFTNIDGAVIS